NERTHKNSGRGSCPDVKDARRRSQGPAHLPSDLSPSPEKNRHDARDAKVRIFRDRDLASWRHGVSTGSIPRFSTNAATSFRPCLVFKLVNRNGRWPRIFLASRSITSSDAPTAGARSILLMTSRSDRVIPGPPLRGILSPAAT